ncbi:MAG TPA: cytochrome c [Ferruginibacter sp.]|nr:cytochrome c [Ferruginibacter sp.]
MKYLFFGLMIAIFLGCNSSDQTNRVSPEMISKGEELFTKSNCPNCHKPDDDFVGPALKDAALRWTDKKSLYAFVRNPDSVMAVNSYAQSLQQKYGGLMMVGSPNLSNKDIDAILAYCNQ